MEISAKTLIFTLKIPRITEYFDMYRLRFTWKFPYKKIFTAYVI